MYNPGQFYNVNYVLIFYLVKDNYKYKIITYVFIYKNPMSYNEVLHEHTQNFNTFMITFL